MLDRLSQGATAAGGRGMSWWTTDETHDPARTSWVESANGHPDFPIQNLPYGVFSSASGEAGIGVAIGDRILDLFACATAGLLPASIAPLCTTGTLNGVMALSVADRRALLSAFDRFRREADSSGLMSGLDSFNEQAFGMLTSSRLLEALNVEKEPAALRARYGKGDAKVHGDAAPMLNEQFLVARRLVEAGARFVTVAYGFWDYHGNNFGNARNDLPMLDQALSALIGDLHDRGLDRDVSVVAWGEFGRSPTINKDGGRDHWPRANCAVLAGGGMKAGQVIGATDRLGGEPSERPVQFGEVFATLYRNLGIDVNQVTLPDLTGRPQFLVPDGCQPMKELLG